VTSVILRQGTHEHDRALQLKFACGPLSLTGESLIVRKVCYVGNQDTLGSDHHRVLIVLATTWAATQWTAWRLGFQPQLGLPWFQIAPGMLVYPPLAFFWWWYAYDAYAPRIFLEGAGIAASGGFISMAVAVGMLVWRARETTTIVTPLGDTARGEARRPARAGWCGARTPRPRVSAP
jgi:hypothetical protein